MIFATFQVRVQRVQQSAAGDEHCEPMSFGEMKDAMFLARETSCGEM